jgi:hypothetical protein
MVFPPNERIPAKDHFNGATGLARFFAGISRDFLSDSGSWI